MSETGTGHGHGSGTHAKTPISVPWVVISALLIGGGILLIVTWLTYFDWIYFSGVFLLLVGGLMLFSPRAGIDQALPPRH